jgi:3-oxoadipate enol-lactonase
MVRRKGPTFLEVDGGKIAFDVAGRGRGIVLVHAAIADRRMWDREYARLSKGHRVVRYDQRGFGESTPAQTPFASFRDLGALVTHLELDRPIVVGCSMGGRIALDLALEFPDSVTGLLLVAPGPPSGLEESMVPEAKEALAVNARDSQAMSAAWTAGDVDRAIEIAVRCWGSALTGESLAKFRAMVGENAAESFGDRSALHDTPPDPPAVGRLGAVSIPVEILLGDRDDPLLGYFANFIAGRIPGSRLQIVPGGDHLLNLSRPAEFDGALANFLTRTARMLRESGE